MHTSINNFHHHNTPPIIVVVENTNGLKWYCIEGSETINKTFDLIEEDENAQTRKVYSPEHKVTP